MEHYMENDLDSAFDLYKKASIGDIDSFDELIRTGKKAKEEMHEIFEEMGENDTLDTIVMLNLKCHIENYNELVRSGINQKDTKLILLSTINHMSWIRNNLIKFSGFSLPLLNNITAYAQSLSSILSLKLEFMFLKFRILKAAEKIISSGEAIFLTEETQGKANKLTTKTKHNIKKDKARIKRIEETIKIKEPLGYDVDELVTELIKLRSGL